MTCCELIACLGELIDGEMDDGLRAGAEHHLGECPRCTLLRESYHFTIRLSRRLPLVALTAEQQTRLRLALVTNWLVDGGSASPRAI